MIKIKEKKDVKKLNQEMFTEQKLKVLEYLTQQYNLLVLGANQCLCFDKESHELIIWFDCFSQYSSNNDLLRKYKERLHYEENLKFTNTEHNTFGARKTFLKEIAAAIR